MHVTFVHVHVKPENIKAFIEALRSNHEASIHEPGNRRFDVLQDPDDHSRFCIYEAYASEDNAKAHKLTAHYVTWRDAVAPMMADPRSGKTWRGLFPAG